MYLKSLSLVNFKNFAQFDLSFSEKLNCFVGLNGAGKTNLLDAIYYLSFTKSYFNIPDNRSIRFEENFFVLQAEYLRFDRQEKIYCAFKKNQKKQFKRNTKEYKKLSEHIGYLPLVIVSPNDAALITGGSEERRRFIDQVISQYNNQYLDNLIRYNKALIQRNALLKDFYTNNYFDSTSLEIWTDQLINLGKAIHEERKIFIKEFLPIFYAIHIEIAKDAEIVNLNYSSVLLEIQSENMFLQSLEKDRFMQYTTSGIHRDDLELIMENNPIKKYGSQGQQKTFLLALKFAQFMFLKKICGFAPLLLLDDIFDKLDSNRVTHILKLITEKDFGQMFITDTSTTRLKNILENISVDYKIFNVSANLQNSEIISPQV